MIIERVYREILSKLLDSGRKERFKQLTLSEDCKMSISTVNYALKPLEEMNAVEKSRFGFIVTNPKKILLYWASVRRLKKDIVYQTFVNEKIDKLESSIPANAMLTAYSAFKLKFKRTPSDYSEVVVYGNKEDFEARFGKENKKMKSNLIVLGLDEHMLKFKVSTIAQIFVDLWNLNTWYAEDFLKALEGEIDGILDRLGYR